MKIFSDMLIAALYATLIQNLVLNSVFGISEAMRIAKRPKHFFMHCMAVTYFCFTTSMICFLLRKIDFIAQLSDMYMFLLSCVVLCVIYLCSGVFLVKVYHANKKFMNSLGMCAFNCLVLSIPLIDVKANYGFFEIIGNSIGAAIAFAMAIFLINAGMRYISNNDKIPKVFSGTPVILIYVAILSLAISCLSTDTLFV